jgi:exonuclease VII large subunit
MPVDQERLDRLAQNNRKPVELPPLVERKVLTTDVMNKSLERLYTNSVQHKKKMMEELDKKQNPDMVKHTTLDQDSLEGMFTRLYSQSMQQREANLDKLKSRYLDDKCKKVKLSKDQIGDSANRLCNQSVDSTKEKHAKLFEKYVTSTAPTYKKLNSNEVKASADRLCQKK